VFDFVINYHIFYGHVYQVVGTTNYLSFPRSAWELIPDVLHPMIYMVPATCRHIRANYLKMSNFVLATYQFYI